MRAVKIYKLIDPRDNLVKYIGKTVNSLNFRFYHHLRSTERTKKGSWIKSLLKLKKLPIIELIEECSEDMWEERERYWISFYKETGYLKNMTDGGIGNKEGLMKKEVLLTKSQSMIGHECKPITRERIRNKILGIKRSKETKNKIRLANIGKKYSMDEILKRNPKPVMQLTLDMQEIAEFYSINEASRKTGVGKGSISGACNGIYKTGGGYKWKFK